MSGVSILYCSNKAVFLVATKDTTIPPMTQMGGIGGGNIVAVGPASAAVNRDPTKVRCSTQIRFNYARVPCRIFASRSGSRIDASKQKQEFFRRLT